MDFRTLFLLLLAVLLLACSNDDENNPVPTGENPLLSHSYPQEWRLFKTTGSFEGSETTGDDLEWQETYVLRSDSTFTKIRVKENGTMTGSGTFFIAQNEDSTTILSLTYLDEDNPIIATCYGNNKEYLDLDPDTDILISTWQECDGPGLFYEIVE